MSFPNNHEEEPALQKLRWYISWISLKAAQPEKWDQLMGKYRAISEAHQDLNWYRPSVIVID